MTQPTKPRPRPEKIATATALMGVFGEWPDPSLRNLCETYLTGDATFFGVPMFENNNAYHSIRALIIGTGVDLDAMENHYNILCERMG